MNTLLKSNIHIPANAGFLRSFNVTLLLRIVTKSVSNNFLRYVAWF